MHPNSQCTKITKIQDLIKEYATRHGRDNESVALLAVSKTRTSKEIQQAIDCGLTSFGENYAQEMHDKAVSLGQKVVDWHFIGPIQSNKTKIISQSATWVHTIDRMKTARRFDRHCSETSSRLQVCLQVNIDAEPNKSGVLPGELTILADQVAELDTLDLRGLMIVPAIRTAFDEQRRVFARCRGLLESLNDSGHNMDTLSMGMSADFEAAIAEGATIIRVGTALFGPRRTN